MNKALNQSVIEAVRATDGKIDDYGQRGAIGMARTFLEERVPVKVGVNSMDRYPGRDALAVSLSEILTSASKEDGIIALAGARAMVNAPFIDERVQAQRARQIKSGPVGSEKKNEKMGLK